MDSMTSEVLHRASPPQGDKYTEPSGSQRVEMEEILETAWTHPCPSCRWEN